MGLSVITNVKLAKVVTATSTNVKKASPVLILYVLTLMPNHMNVAADGVTMVIKL